MKASWLFSKHPILVDKDLASTVGLNEAIVLQQLNYWLHSKSAKQINGRLWIYNTYENWKKQNFPFWSERTIRRAFNSLEQQGIVVTDNFNRAGFDKTKWYSIDETVLNDLMASPSGQSGQTMCPKSPDGDGQVDRTYTRDYTENTTENTSLSSSADSEEEDDEKINQIVSKLLFSISCYNKNTHEHVQPSMRQVKQIRSKVTKLSDDCIDEFCEKFDYQASNGLITHPVGYLLKMLDTEIEAERDWKRR